MEACKNYKNNTIVKSAKQIYTVKKIFDMNYFSRPWYQLPFDLIEYSRGIKHSVDVVKIVLCLYNRENDKWALGD